MKTTSPVVVIQASRLNSCRKPVAFVSIYVIRNAQLLKTTTSCAKIRTVMITGMLLGSRCSTGSRISLGGDQCQPYTLVNMIQNKTWNSKKGSTGRGHLSLEPPLLYPVMRWYYNHSLQSHQAIATVSSLPLEVLAALPWSLSTFQECYLVILHGAFSECWETFRQPVKYSIPTISLL